MTNLSKTAIILEDVCALGGAFTETDFNGNSGTSFPYGAFVKYECDKHRENYTEDDARAVAAMVNQSSWIARNR